MQLNILEDAVQCRLPDLYVQFLSCVLYCPLVPIPSNSSTTEYKLVATTNCYLQLQSTWPDTWGQGPGPTSQVHLLQHLRHVLPHHSCSAHVMLVLSWTFPSRKLAHYVKTGMWSSMWSVKEFRQGWTCQKYRYFETSNFCKECRKIWKIFLMSQTSMEWSCDNRIQNSKFQFYSSLKNK